VTESVQKTSKRPKWWTITNVLYLMCSALTSYYYIHNHKIKGLKQYWFVISVSMCQESRCSPAGSSAQYTVTKVSAGLCFHAVAWLERAHGQGAGHWHMSFSGVFVTERPYRVVAVVWAHCQIFEVPTVVCHFLHLAMYSLKPTRKIFLQCAKMKS
jgi:hypothetical protein